MVTQIVLNDPTNIVDISCLSDQDFDGKIVVYETKSHSDELGLGVLVQCTDNQYGFVYHRTLINGKRCNAAFKGYTKFIAIKYALEAGRKIFMFKSFEEFVNHAAESVY